jgi:hypothetical protein
MKENILFAVFWTTLPYKALQQEVKILVLSLNLTVNSYGLPNRDLSLEQFLTKF